MTDERLEIRIDPVNDGLGHVAENEESEEQMIHEQSQFQTSSTCVSKLLQSYEIFFILSAAQSTGVQEAITYAGLVYYEERRAEDLVTFVAAKDLNALLEVTLLIFCNNIVTLFLVY